jgi:NTP pyrophosphatase (non-canonical NTP hydrolase)
MCETDRKKSDFDLYQEMCLETLKEQTPEQNLAMCALGIAGESGEVAELMLTLRPDLRDAIGDLKLAAMRVAEITKKNVFHRHDIDRPKIVKELGDLLWYVSVFAHSANINLSEVARENVKKLRRRYEGGYSDQKSQCRVDASGETPVASCAAK